MKRKAILSVLAVAALAIPAILYSKHIPSYEEGLKEQGSNRFSLFEIYCTNRDPELGLSVADAFLDDEISERKDAADRWAKRWANGVNPHDIDFECVEKGYFSSMYL